MKGKPLNHNAATSAQCSNKYTMQRCVHFSNSTLLHREHASTPREQQGEERGEGIAQFSGAQKGSRMLVGSCYSSPRNRALSKNLCSSELLPLKFMPETDQLT